MQQEFYDIVVLGGGLVGSSFLLAQAQASPQKTLKIALIDKQSLENSLHPPLNNFSMQASHRVDPVKSANARAIALSHSSIQALKKLKVWEVLDKNVTPIKEVHVSSKGQFGVTHLKAESLNLKAVGAVIDADILNLTLNQMASQLPKVTVFRPDEVKRCESYKDAKNNAPAWKLSLASGKILVSHLLVGADGTESFVRRHFGVDVTIEDYQQQAIVSNLLLSADHHNIAYERFLPREIEQCSIALLPFGDNRVKCILIVHQNQSKTLLSLPDSEYLTFLQEAFGFRLGRFKELGKRFSYPLKTIAAEAIYGAGWVLLGNAANTLHPLAAQGFNLGLRDAIALADVLNTALESEADFANIKNLQAYSKKRKSDHFYTGLFTRTLVKKQSYLQLGILASEFLPQVKRKVMLQGSGLIQRSGLVQGLGSI